jgi:uncharacterized protein (DUF2062 family)
MLLQNTSLPEGAVKKESFFKRKLIQPVFNFLKQGISPEKLALAFTLGILIAVFPVFGSTTLLCFLLVFLFRVNVAAIMLANYFAYPLQFVLYLPFIRLGEYLYNAPGMTFSVSEIFSMFTNDVFAAIAILWWSTMYAVTAWLIISVPLGFLLYYLLKVILEKVAFRYSVKNNRESGL